MSRPVLVGRSSSHFTRVARIFAAEVEAPCDLHVVRDLLARDPEDYGGHPGLKIPSLRIADATWFGALPICRELVRRGSVRRRVVWPEDLHEPLLSNAQELVVHAMGTEVALVMSRIGGSDTDRAVEERPYPKKLAASLLGATSWLEEHADRFLPALPERDLSFLEVTLFCLIEHLAFRDVIPVAPYGALERFRSRFAERASSMATAFRFDA